MYLKDVKTETCSLYIVSYLYKINIKIKVLLVILFVIFILIYCILYYLFILMTRTIKIINYFVLAFIVVQTNKKNQNICKKMIMSNL